MDLAYWALILLLLGLSVIALELFVPSGGLLGILAVILLLSSVVVGFLSDWRLGGVMLAVIAVMIPIILLAFIRLWPRTPIGKRILIGPVEHEEVMPRGGYYDELRGLIGKRGLAKTKMLPSGLVVIDGRSYDAVSDGFPIDQGDPIEVIAMRTHRIVVRRAEEQEQPAATETSVDDILSRPIEDFGLGPIDDLR